MTSDATGMAHMNAEQLLRAVEFADSQGNWTPLYDYAEAVGVDFIVSMLRQLRDGLVIEMAALIDNGPAFDLRAAQFNACVRADQILKALAFSAELRREADAKRQKEELERQRKAQERLTTLRQRRCHFSRCHRLILSQDETETYCRLHRSPEQRRDARELERRLRVVPKQPKPQTDTRIIERASRPPSVSVTDPDVPLLRDRICEVDVMPPEQSLPSLQAEVDRRASQLMSWNYYTLGRRHSRRYENYNNGSRY